MGKAKGPDKQLNIRVKPPLYRRLEKAARRERLTVTAYARGAIIDRLNGGQFEAQDLNGIPAWLLHVLLFFAQRGDSRRGA